MRCTVLCWPTSLRFIYLFLLAFSLWRMRGCKCYSKPSLLTCLHSSYGKGCSSVVVHLPCLQKTPPLPRFNPKHLQVRPEILESCCRSVLTVLSLMDSMVQLVRQLSNATQLALLSGGWGSWFPNLENISGGRTFWQWLCWTRDSSKTPTRIPCPLADPMAHRLRSDFSSK